MQASAVMLSLGQLCNRRLIVQTICHFLSNGMHPTCKLLTFLRVRAACRALVVPITAEMARRVITMMQHESSAVKNHAKKVKDSGFLHHCLFCGGPPMANHILVPGPEGIPYGMTEQYWHDLTKKHKISGWKDGRLHL